MNSATVMHGIRWNLVTTVIRRGFSLIFLFFLASWLSQSDLGIYRTYSLILTIAAVFAILGLDSNYITGKKLQRLNLFAFAQIGTALGLLVSLILALSSAWLAKLYNSPELCPILRFTSLFVLVEVLRRLLRSYAQTRLKFRELALGETWNVLFYCVAGLVAIYFIRKVWVYVVFFYLGNLVETLYLYCVLPPLPYLKLRRLWSFKWLGYSLGVLKRYRNFLANVSIIRLLNNYAGNAPILFLGTMVSAALMGQYFFATQLIGVPVMMFTLAVGQVFYPVFAQSLPERSLQSISSYTRLILGLGIPILIGYGLLISHLLPHFFGGKWNDSLPLMIYLIPFFGSGMLNDPISAIPFVCRKPHLELVWNVVSLGLRLLTLAWGMRFGFPIAILLFSLVSALMNLAFYIMSLILLKANLREATLQLLAWSAGLLILIALLLPLGNFPLAWLWQLLLIALYILCVLAVSKATYGDFKRLFR